eukprot:UN04588
MPGERRSPSLSVSYDDDNPEENSDDLFEMVEKGKFVKVLKEILGLEENESGELFEQIETDMNGDVSLSAATRNSKRPCPRIGWR